MGKDTNKTRYFPLSVGNIDSLMFLGKLEHPYESRIRQQYHYEGVLVPDICTAMGRMPVSIETIGVPHKVLSRYGTPEQHDEALGLTPGGIRRRVERFLSE